MTTFLKPTTNMKVSTMKKHKKTQPTKRPAGRELFALMCDLAVIRHPAVVMPKEPTLINFIRANPPAEFLRRLEAFDPSNN
jgi:hypothetical protein